MGKRATGKKTSRNKSSRLVGKPWETAKSGKGSATDPLAVRFVESLSYDRRLYKHDIAGSIAHARMLRKVGLIKAVELTKIERGLRAIEKEIDQQDADWSGWKVEMEDVHMCIEAALIEKIGEPGKKLHTGRSRNDQVALDLKLWIGDAEDRLAHEYLQGLIKAFVELANRDGLIVLPGYTHLQRAQPITLGAELLAWAQSFFIAKDRFGMFDSCQWLSPLGSGAIAGSALPLDRTASVELLGQVTGPPVRFCEPSENSIESTASRDKAIDFVYGLAMTAMWLSRWAEQWIIYMTSEFGFIKIGDAYTTGSSMMPQKRNPDMLELIRGRCGGVYGHLVALLTICKGLTIGYNRDLQEDKRHVFAAYDTVKDSLEMAAKIVLSTKFTQPDMTRGFMDATSLAEYLVTRGVAFRTAHQIVGSLVHQCERRGFEQLSQLELADLNTACDAAGAGSDRCGKDVYDWLGAENVVKRYCTAGNAGLSGLREQLKVWKQRLK